MRHKKEPSTTFISTFNIFKVQRKYNQWAPIHIAVICEKLHLCKYIIQNSDNKNPKQNDGITALHFAAQTGNPEICSLVIENLVEKNPGKHTGFFDPRFISLH